MTNSLPYIFLDNDFNLNLALLILILDEFGINSKDKKTLDFDKLQILLYLTKNPSKINQVLQGAGKKSAMIESLHTHTIESKSSNVDILFKREKTKSLIKSTAYYGFLATENAESGSIMFFLSDDGKAFSTKLKDDHFDSVRRLLLELKPIISVPNTKLFSILSNIFKGL